MRRALRPVLAVAGTAVLVVALWTLPRVAGTSWPAVADKLTGISPSVLALLAAVWLAGLAAHTLVQTAALPGLRSGRALTLNLATSAVASGLPGGGPLSLAANWAILRSWGFTATEFSTYTLVSTLTVVAAKLSLPVVAAAVVAAAGGDLPRPVRNVVLVGGGCLVAGAGVLAALRRSWRPVRELMTRSADVVRRGHRELAAGGILQLAAQYALFVLCLRAAGAEVGLVAALVGFTAGRALSALPVTPAGLGVTEAGSGTVLVTLGADPQAAVAGVVLFSVFAVLLEIPIGTAALLVWWLTPASARAQPRPSRRPRTLLR